MDYKLDKKDILLQGDWHGKDVTSLPGIGEKNGEKLRANGCVTVDDVLRIYLKFGKSKEKFLEWLHSCGVTKDQHKRPCYRCIKEIAKTEECYII